MNPEFSGWQSLKTRATVFTLGAFVFGLWALSFYTSHLLQSDMQQLLGEQQMTVVSAVAKEVDEHLTQRLQALETVAKEVDAGLMGHPEALQNHLAQRTLLHPLFNAGVWVAGLDGIAMAEVPLSAQRLGVSYLSVDFINATLKEGKATISRPVIGKKRERPIVAMAVPIRDTQGGVMGVMVGVTDLGDANFLDKIIQNAYGKTGGYLLIHARSRQIITATDKKRIMEQLPAAGINPFVDRNIAGYEGYSVLVNALGEQQLASVKQVPVAGWYVLLGTPTAEAFAPLRDLQQRTLLATLLLTMLMGVLTWWILKRQLSPLVATANAMVALADANHTAQPLPATRPDEIGQLVAGFNRILARWSDREAALKESQQNLAITLNSIGDAVIATDATGLITRMNPTAERMTAWPLADALGQPLSTVFRIINATTRQPVTDPVQLVMAHGHVVGLANHTVLLAKDGQEYQIADSAAPIRNAADQIVGVVLVFSGVTENHRVEGALIASEARLQNLLQDIPYVAVQGYGADGTTRYWNQASEQLYGYRADEAIGRSLLDTIIPAEMHEGVRQAMQQMFQTGIPIPAGELSLRRKDGARVEVFSSHAYVHVPGQAPEMFCLDVDITERKRSEEALRIAATAFESQQGMAITNAKRVILRVNRAFTSITGYSAQEAVGQPPALLTSGRHDSAFYAAIDQALATDGAWAGEIWHRRKSGEVYPEWLTLSVVKDDAGYTTHYVAIFSDISDRLKALAQIDTLAFYDPLTQLPNRRLLLDRLAQALQASTRHARKSALLFVDLDNFKTLNDTQGHHQGDMLLVQVAQRLKTCLRDGDTLARLGSDEFVVMLEDMSEDAIEAATQAETVGDNILKAFEQDFSLDLGAHHSTPSIGVTLFGGATLEGSEQPLQRAELAMFQAKSAGRNTLRFFDAQMQAEVTAHAALEADLREAVQKRQFLLHYQPQVVGTGRVTGVEALVRWQHPLRGMVSPAQFIPQAEESGLILPIGQWVLESACAQLTAWASDPALAHLTVAVNVSARQFKQLDFVDSVLATLARTQANPRRLKLELTESMLVDNVDAIIAKMGTLKAQGVSFSLDDFGTGYSSLAYLKRLPLDQLKIDQGFVRNIVTDPNDTAIARMVVVLAESMGLSVIAEGVELQAQADFLAHLGCHAYQGYLFSKPLPLAEFEVFARTRY